MNAHRKIGQLIPVPVVRRGTLPALILAVIGSADATARDVAREGVDRIAAVRAMNRARLAGLITFHRKTRDGRSFTTTGLGEAALAALEKRCRIKGRTLSERRRNLIAAVWPGGAA